MIIDMRVNNSENRSFQVMDNNNAIGFDASLFG